MSHEIKIPSMGESISEVTIGNIIKPSGSYVKADEEILELETDKVNQVLYAPTSGVITLNIKENDVVKIGAVIGSVDASAAPQEKSPEKEPPKKAPPVQPVVEKPAEKPTPAPVTGKARMMQEDFIKDLATPVEKSAAVSTSTPAPKPSSPSNEPRETRKKLPKIRRVIADRLLSSSQNTAMLTTFNEVDMSAILELREKYKEIFLKQHGSKLGFMSFFVKAVVSALEAVPGLNSYIDGDELVQRNYFDIGIAVGTERGLIVPVLRDCEKLGIAQVEKSIEDFAKAARDGKLTVDALQGGSFTITNGGVYGSLLSTPILNPPQSGILGMHKIEKRPVVVNDQIVIRPMMYLALSYDHRVVDGKEAVTFLVHVKNCLEDPARMLLNL
jgi:2-oxoglutarate dehydrogenase E2 component (dihydrolipoamide succinyltransferase)